MQRKGKKPALQAHCSTLSTSSHILCSIWGHLQNSSPRLLRKVRPKSPVLGSLVALQQFISFFEIECIEKEKTIYKLLKVFLKFIAKHTGQFNVLPQSELTQLACQLIKMSTETLLWCPQRVYLMGSGLLNNPQLLAFKSTLWSTDSHRAQSTIYPLFCCFLCVQQFGISSVASVK